MKMEPVGIERRIQIIEFRCGSTNRASYLIDGLMKSQRKIIYAVLQRFKW